jgi:hypothetical protein
MPKGIYFPLGWGVLGSFQSAISSGAVRHVLPRRSHIIALRFTGNLIGNRISYLL